jgi:hypothetical protein
MGEKSSDQTKRQEQLDIQYYKFILRHIEREENLVNRRIAWMLTFQGFLFATIALLANNSVDAKLRTNLEFLLPATGCIVGLLALVGVHAAYSSINEKLGKWDKEGKKDIPSDILKKLPEITSNGASFGGKLLSYGLPLLFFVIWGILIFQQLGVFRMF